MAGHEELSLGVDVGGTKVLGVIIDPNGTVIDEERVPTPRGTPALIAAMAHVVNALQQRRIAHGAPIVDFVGIGVPGSVSRDGVIVASPHLPDVENAPVADLLRAQLTEQAKIHVDNDANCAAWGERCFGAGGGVDELLFVTLGTGIGGGIITGGKLMRGSKGFAGEIGHMVVDVNGTLCVCGQRGCWERYASGSGLGRLAREAAYAYSTSMLVEIAGGDPDDVKGEHVTAAAERGDPIALDVMGTFAWWLAVGLVNLFNAFDPERIVIGGGIAEAGDVLLVPARAAFASLLYGSELRGVVPISLAVPGERTNAVGAAALKYMPA